MVAAALRVGAAAAAAAVAGRVERLRIGWFWFGEARRGEERKGLAMRWRL